MGIRKATTTDVPDIQKILNHYGSLGLLLARPLSELYDHLRDFFVLETDEKGIIGVCALRVCWEDLAEIKSLAVKEDQQHRGMGTQMVQLCLEDARSLGLKRVFTLTYVPDFFKRLGFREVEKSVLPHKIWSDCLKCTKFPDCDEIALITEL
jgi:amino-acid N-acetyltransferase